VQAAGGTVIAPAFDVGDQGRMAVFQDPSGAFISAWQPADMDGFHADGTNEFSWAELSSRALDQAVAFYGTVFGWTAETSPMGDGAPYTSFKVDGSFVAGGQDMNPMVPAEMPSYWLVYFGVDDVDASFRTVLDAGGREMMPPTDFPGGRFAIVSDPQGAAFGLLRTRQR
jgi:predicted enzyme related to lactoylglutathione lyase